MIRNSRIDVARGLLMFYIIAIIHGIYWLQLIGGSARSFLLFEMPCIFFISGYSFALTERGGIRVHSVGDYLKFLMQRGSRILIPYWFYAAVCLCFLFLKGDSAKFGTASEKLAALASWANPLEYGKNHSMAMLEIHLWFIAPFLGVTLVMPLITKFGVIRRWPLWALLPCFFCAIVGADYFLNDMGRYIVSYGIWSVIGYLTGRSHGATLLTPRRTTALFAVASTAMGAIWLFNLSPMDMQENKFPPNYTFFLFGLAWLSAILYVCSFISEAFVGRLAESKLLRPFITKGYSIYLWQGLAYTLATYAGAKYSLPILLVWVIAVCATIVLGILASPIESIRLSSGRGAKVALPPTALSCSKIDH